MNPEIKQKWITALRSGEYKQTRGVLQSPGGFCCLGVLCDIIDPSGWTQTQSLGEIGHYGETAVPIAEICGVAGIRLGKDTVELTRLNDENGLSFSEIADWIEKNL